MMRYSQQTDIVYPKAIGFDKILIVGSNSFAITSYNQY